MPLGLKAPNGSTFWSNPSVCGYNGSRYAEWLLPLWALGAGFAAVSGMADTKTESSARRLVLAVYADFPSAELAVTLLQREEFPMDRVSLLGQTSATGDDPIGVYYPRAGERIRGWGKQGAFWGALWGLVAGGAGMFLLPGIGPILAAGPLVDALVGAMAGAGIGGGVMAGAGAVAHLSSAIHRMGVPREDLDGVVEEIEQGAHVVMLIVFSEDAEHWAETLALTKPKTLRDYPYVGLAEAASSGSP